jgi:hypothetical protein
MGLDFGAHRQIGSKAPVADAVLLPQEVAVLAESHENDAPQPVTFCWLLPGFFAFCFWADLP